MTSFGKKSWVELFREIGLDEAKMHQWHAAFERRWPQEHQRFLEWLEVPPTEIDRIRGDSRAGAPHP